MVRLLEIALVGAVGVAVLAFGGTAPSFFAITQVIILGLGVLFILSGQVSRITSTDIPIVSPLLLFAFVLLQVCPLSRFLAPLFGRTPDDLVGESHFTVSMAPYQTVSHLLLLVTYLTAFFLTLVLCRDPNAKRRLVFAMLSLGVFEALYGLIQYLTGWQQIFTYVKNTIWKRPPAHTSTATISLVFGNDLAVCCGSCFALGETAVSEYVKQNSSTSQNCFQDGAAFSRILALSCYPSLRRPSPFAFADGDYFGPGFTGCHSGARWNCVHAGAHKGGSRRIVFSRCPRAGRVDRQ